MLWTGTALKQQHEGCASFTLVLCMALTDPTGHCPTLRAAGGWLYTTGCAGVSSYLLAHGTWQNQQGNALPRQETATKEQLGDSGQWLPGLSSCG